jgi:glycosyltransferase involved in cell wall biosynthesis
MARVETVHDMIVERFPEYFPHAERMRDAKRIACQHADIIIAVSDHTRRMLTEYLGVPHERIRVIHHGVSSFATDERRVAELGVAPPFLLFVGKRGGYKNFTGLIHAFAASDAAKNGIVLRAFGGGKPTAMEVEQISSLKLDGLVEFDAGSDAELSANYRTALALVYPGLEEGFGMPPLEAMTHGCPVIASSAGGIPEVVGDAAAMFDPTVVESITSAIDAVVSDESLRRTLSARSVDRAELFTWENAATKTVAAYAAALEIARGRT